MAFELENVVPWGRSLDEYQRMFSLNKDDFGKRILGCGDGPASFNAEATSKGLEITSVDPIYQFAASQIRERIKAVRVDIMEKTRAHQSQFLWNYFKDPDDLEMARMSAMDRFLNDFEQGLAACRYICASLPSLPFEDQSFDLALVSHLLFLYSDLLNEDFHLKSIAELLRVSREVRIFPLRDLRIQKSVHIAPVFEQFNKNYSVEIIEVDYEFQKGGNQMLVIKQ